MPEPVRCWYVVAKDPPENNHTDVFGPFYSETDAKAYAIDIQDDNGWVSIEAVLIEPGEAMVLSTSGEPYWPYEDKPQ